MTKINCDNCSKAFSKSPSHVQPRNFCSRECYAVVRNAELAKNGEANRFKKGQKSIAKNQPTGTAHYAWKGDGVGYRGLHQWLMRRLGKPTKCGECSKVDTRPRFIQWANIDGKYRRLVCDYIPLCVSCHKNYDIKLKSTRDESVANQ